MVDFFKIKKDFEKFDMKENHKIILIKNLRIAIQQNAFCKRKQNSKNEKFET